jgi:GntR family transcriptional regulator of arabinose operon
MNMPLYEQLYNYVVKEITAGRLQPGDRVPSEKELAGQFGVSRITSKKALERLRQDGLIERMRGRGSFVSTDVSAAKLQGLASEAAAKESRESRHLVGLLLPDLSDSYGLRLVRSVDSSLREQGYYMLLCCTNGRSQEEEQAIAASVEMGADGLIVFPVHGEFYSERLLRLVLDHYPLVLVDRYLKGIPACSVFTDNRAAAADLTDYLIERGHTELAFVSPPAQGTSAIEERIQGVTAALAARGVSFDPQDCSIELYSTLPGAFNTENVSRDADTIRRFLDAHPQVTALVACEYNIALVLEHTLAGMGRRVPEDCSIVCFDSVEYPVGAPRFTHIRQDEEAMGRQAVELLMGQIGGRDVPLQTVIKHQLVEGSSTGPAQLA